MRYFFVVAIVQRVHHLLEKSGGNLFVEMLHDSDFLEQFSARAQFSYEIDMLFALEPLVQPYDIWMILTEWLCAVLPLIAEYRPR